LCSDTGTPYLANFIYRIVIDREGSVAIMRVGNGGTPYNEYNRYIYNKIIFTSKDIQDFDKIIINGTKNCSFTKIELIQLIQNIETFLKDLHKKRYELFRKNFQTSLEKVRKLRLGFIEKDENPREQERLNFIERVMAEQERNRKEKEREEQERVMAEQERNRIKKREEQERINKELIDTRRGFEKFMAEQERIVKEFTERNQDQKRKEQDEIELCNKRAKEGAIKHREAKENLKNYIKIVLL